jgi:hypothetical protein
VIDQLAGNIVAALLSGTTEKPSKGPDMPFLPPEVAARFRPGDGFTTRNHERLVRRLADTFEDE